MEREVRPNGSLKAGNSKPSEDSDNRFSSLLQAIKDRDQIIVDHLLGSVFKRWFQSRDLQEGVYAYLRRPAKRLRPAVLLFACGAVGGDESVAIPAAASVEVFHTWTLVHDDIIDNDNLRRGGPTVHRLFSDKASEHDKRDSIWANEYGRDLAILVGDSQQGWSVWLLLETAVRDPRLMDVIMGLTQHLESHVINRMIEGEILDIQFTKEPPAEIRPEAILQMLYLKTGALYEFAAMAGAAIGLCDRDLSHPWLKALAEFAKQCGTAFQLQDDILGVVGNEGVLGKPVGSDIREGKRTIVAHYAFARANSIERKRLGNIIGRRDASEADIDEVRSLFVDLGAIRDARAVATRITEGAIQALSVLPDSPYKDLLSALARFLIEREL